MIQTVLPDLFRLEIPLPDSPLKAVNSYVIRGADRSLVIDTGFNHRVCLDAMREGLRELDVDLRKTDFYLTHFHSDHFGLITKLITDTSTVYFNRPDFDILRGPGRLEAIIAYASASGFPDDDLQEMLYNHPGYKYKADYIPELRLVTENDTLSVGDYRLAFVTTSGHTKGHTCLYEPERKILFSGDHILGSITPNITCWSDEENPLSEYLDSLERIYQLDVELVLPGHRSIFRDHRKRIDELKRHHRRRAEEILTILQKGPQAAFRIAARMSWDLTYESWDLFPRAQKWFATGETVAHLRYLEQEGNIRRNADGPGIVFSLNPPEACAGER